MAPPNEARVFGERVRLAVLTPANSIRPVALPKRLVLGKAVRPSRRRSKANGRNYSASPNIEMGKAAKPTTYPAAIRRAVRANISPRMRLNA